MQSLPSLVKMPAVLYDHTRESGVRWRAGMNKEILKEGGNQSIGGQGLWRIYGKMDENLSDVISIGEGAAFAD